MLEREYPHHPRVTSSARYYRRNWWVSYRRGGGEGEIWSGWFNRFYLRSDNDDTDDDNDDDEDYEEEQKIRDARLWSENSHRGNTNDTSLFHKLESAAENVSDCNSREEVQKNVNTFTDFSQKKIEKWNTCQCIKHTKHFSASCDGINITITDCGTNDTSKEKCISKYLATQNQDFYRLKQRV